MADEYYTLEQAMQKLALTKEQLANLVREGRIREFRIEGQQKFKTQDIDAMASEINPSFSSAADATDTDIGSESAIELLPVDTSDASADAVSLEETGDQSGSSADSGQKPAKQDTVATPSGVNVFDEDELAGIDADPMAKTQIAPTVSDEVSVESGGSGSGLLDLSRESDDTSLGGVLDEIYSGEETMPEAEAPPTGDQDAAEIEGFEEAEEPRPAAASQAVALQVADPLAGVFTGLLVAAAVLVAFTGLVAASLTAGVLPGFIKTLSGNIIFYLIGAVVVVLAGVGAGFALGRRG